MKRLALYFLILIVVLPFCLFAHIAPCFIYNAGQLQNLGASQALYYYNSPFFQIFFFNNKISYVFQQPQIDPITKKYKAYRIDLLFYQPCDAIALEAFDKKKGYYNFYMSLRPEGVEKVASYGKLLYKNVWKGIDIEFLFDTTNIAQSRLKYNIIVHKEADIKNIQFQYLGQDKLQILPSGALEVSIDNQSVFQEKIPFSFIKIRANKQIIDIRYQKNKDNLIGFNIPNLIDKEAELVIDPIVWSTFLGGASFDRGNAIEVDREGNICVAGDTRSLNFPTRLGQSFIGRPADAYYAKFSPSGELVWCTLYGGSNEEQGHALAVDSNNELYFTGRTSSRDFPLPIVPSPFQPNYRGGMADAYILKLNAEGIRIWATYYGGSEYDNVSNIAISRANKITIVGDTDSPDLSFPPGAFQGDLAGTGLDNDVFIAQFDANGTPLWGTYLGGTHFDFAYGVAYDSQENVIVCGQTLSDNFPIIGNGNNLQSALAGNSDAFIAKFNKRGQPIWSSYYGGTGAETAKYLAINTNDEIFIAGQSASPDFPFKALNTPYQIVNNGGSDIFILKFSKDLSPLCNTLFGGSGDERLSGIRLIENQNILISGETRSPNLPFPPLPQPDFANNQGGQDLFLAYFACNSGANCWFTPYWGSYLGGSGGEEAAYHNLGYSKSDNCAYLIGTTQSQNFPRLPGSGNSYFQNYGGGPYDAVLMKVALPCVSPLSFLPLEKEVCPEKPFSLIFPNFPNNAKVYLFDSSSALVPIDSAVASPYRFNLLPTSTSVAYYYRVLSGSNNCLSCRSTVTIKPNLPKQPSFRTSRLCRPGRFTVAFEVNSSDEVIRVYSQENAINPITTLVPPELTYITNLFSQSGEIFAESYNSQNRCASPKIKIPLNLELLPPPSFEPVARCGSGEVVLNFNYPPSPGVILELYSNLDAVAPIAQDSLPPFSFTINITTSVLFYAHVFNKVNGCASSKIPVKVTAHPLPAPPFGFPVGRCESGNLTFTLLRNSNTGSVIYVYSARNGAAIDSLKQEPYWFTTPFLSQSRTYYFRSQDPLTQCLSDAFESKAEISELAGFEKSIVICASESRLRAEKGSQWLWNTGDTRQTITINKSGLYQVLVKDDWGCSAVQKFNATVLGLRFKDTINARLFNCIEEKIKVDTSGLPQPLSIRWAPSGESAVEITVKEKGVYKATLNFPAINCQVERIFNVTQSDSCNQAPYFYAPNAFSPNDDGQNDAWYMHSVNVKEHTLRIYDRWGTMVYENSANGNLSPENSFWNGKKNGIDMPEGVYIFIVDATDRFGNKRQFKGNITLIR
jgi:gliding motility-associated-like protein